jgi:hypothetical protein
LLLAAACVVEGGWSSRNNVPLSDGTPQQQVEFFTKYEALLDSVEAEAWVLLTFTDLDIGTLDLSPDRAAGLSNFAYMGILDTNLQRKPAHAEWLRIFGRRLAD